MVLELSRRNGKAGGTWEVSGMWLKLWTQNLLKNNVWNEKRKQRTDLWERPTFSRKDETQTNLRKTEQRQRLEETGGEDIIRIWE